MEEIDVPWYDVIIVVLVVMVVLAICTWRTLDFVNSPAFTTTTTTIPPAPQSN